MAKTDLVAYWERLERHDWFYAFIEGTDEYAAAVHETKVLFALTSLSRRHAQLYTTYHTVMYAKMIMEDDETVGNIEIPATNKPEAA